MPKTSALFAAAALAALLGGAGLAHAQNPPAPQGTMPHSMPMQGQGGGGMCGGGPGGMCGTSQPAGQPAQGAPMQGMMMQQGQGGTMQGGCAMMQRAASLEQRLRQLEERMGVSAPPPPAEHHHHQHGAPG